VQIIEQCRS